MRGSGKRWAYALGFFGLNVVGVWFTFSTFDSTAPAIAGVVVAAIGAIGFGTVMGFWGSLLYPVVWVSLAIASMLGSSTYECGGPIYSPAPRLVTGPSAAAVLDGGRLVAIARGERCADGTLPSRTAPLGAHALLAIMYGGPLALAAGGATSLGRVDRRRRERERRDYSSSGSP